jgi:hypothetical protein
LVEYPSEGFRQTLMLLLGADVVGTFLWDRFMLALFAPAILRAGFANTSLSVRHTRHGLRRPPRVASFRH